MSDPISLTIGAITVTIGKKIIEKMLDGALTLATGKVNAVLSRWKNKAVITSAYKKMAQVRYVKTFIDLENSIDIYRFYVAAKIKNGESIQQYSSIDQLKSNSISVITGIAGQGKSIFLRFLCAQELALGKRIPLFIELRKINPLISLEEAIAFNLKILGFQTDEPEVVEHLLENDLIAVFFDGFDEVSDEYKLKLSHAIESLQTKYENLRIIVSSRPDSGIETLSICTIYKICHLERDDYQQIISKALDEESSVAMIENLRENESTLGELLSTPLMVNLLIITYRSFSKIPAQLSEFYEDLFDMLMNRHDSIKRHDRKRSTNLNNTDYRLVFEAFCIHSKPHKGELKKSHLVSLAREALTKERKNVDPEHFINDIISITCLIIQDGTSHKFIHKTIQEYYAAAYIKRQSDLVVKQLYSKMMNRNGYMQELYYLSSIDRFRYLKFYLIPLIENRLQMSSKDILEGSFRKDQQTRIILDSIGNARIRLNRIDKNLWTAIATQTVQRGHENTERVFRNFKAGILVFQVNFVNIEHLINEEINPKGALGGDPVQHYIDLKTLLTIDENLSSIWQMYENTLLKCLRDQIHELDQRLQMDEENKTLLDN
jgi:hypothetical protein